MYKNNAKQIIKARSIKKRQRQKAEADKAKYLAGICPSCDSANVNIWKRGNLYECELCR